MNIPVHNKDLGFWTQQEITVQRFDNTSECCYAEVSQHGFCTNCKEHAEPGHNILWCNHAEAEEEEEETYSGYMVNLSRCYKCGATRLVGDTEWQDEPVEGVHDV